MKLLHGAIAITLSLAMLSTSRALTCYGVDATNLYTIPNHTAPGTVTTTLLSGLGGFTPVGLAMRTTVQPGATNPGVGSLWVLTASGVSYKLFVVNPATGACTQIGGALSMDMSGGPDATGFGFDPATDRFRVISVQNNYEINPNTVTVTKQPDIQDASGSNFPATNGAAFSTTSFGGTNQFYLISREVNPRRIETSTNIAAGGQLSFATPASATTMGFGQPMGVDISGSLMLVAEGNSTNHLFSLNRTTGVATDLGLIGASLTLRGLAIRPASFPAPFTVTVAIKGKKKITTTKTKLKIKGTASCGAGITLVQYKVGKGGFKTAKGTTSWNFKAKLKPGTNKIQVKATGGNGVVSSIAKIKVIVKNTTTTTN
jgi:hypothetical protein